MIPDSMQTKKKLGQHALFFPFKDNNKFHNLFSEIFRKISLLKRHSQLKPNEAGKSLYDRHSMYIVKPYKSNCSVQVYHISHESQAMDVSRLESSSIVTDPLRILHPSPSKQITAYNMIKYIRKTLRCKFIYNMKMWKTALSS
jgi:hypothetical protein